MTVLFGKIIIKSSKKTNKEKTKVPEMNACLE